MLIVSMLCLWRFLFNANRGDVIVANIQRVILLFSLTVISAGNIYIKKLEASFLKKISSELLPAYIYRTPVTIKCLYGVISLSKHIRRYMCVCTLLYTIWRLLYPKLQLFQKRLPMIDPQVLTNSSCGHTAPVCLFNMSLSSCLLGAAAATPGCPRARMPLLSLSHVHHPPSYLPPAALR